MDENDDICNDVDFEIRLQPRHTTVKLCLGGMTCSSCVATIENSLNDINGVISASVALVTHSATVIIDSNIIESSILIDTVQSIGFDAEIIEEFLYPYEVKPQQFAQRLSNTASLPSVPKEISSLPHTITSPSLFENKKEKLIICFTPQNMNCQSCVFKLTKALEAIPGVKEAKVNLNGPCVLFCSSNIPVEVIEKVLSSHNWILLTDSFRIVNNGKSMSTSPTTIENLHMSNSNSQDSMNQANALSSRSHSAPNYSTATPSNQNSKTKMIATPRLMKNKQLATSSSAPNNHPHITGVFLNDEVSKINVTSMDNHVPTPYGNDSCVQNHLQLHPPHKHSFSEDQTLLYTQPAVYHHKDLSNNSGDNQINDSQGRSRISSAHECTAKLILKVQFYKHMHTDTATNANENNGRLHPNRRVASHSSRRLQGQEVFDGGADLSGISPLWKKLISHLRSITGIKSIVRIPMAPYLRVSFDPTSVGARRILATAENWDVPQASAHCTITCRVHVSSEAEIQRHKGVDQKTVRFKQSISLALGAIPAILMTLLMVIPASHHPDFLMHPSPVPGLPWHSVTMALLSLPSMLWLGLPIHAHALKSYRAAWRSGVSNGTLGMDALVSTASTLAFVYSCLSLLATSIEAMMYPNASYSHFHAGTPALSPVSNTDNDVSSALPSMPPEFFDTPAVLIWVVLLGRFIESIVKERTAKSLAALASLRPSVCLRMTPPSHSPSVHSGHNNKQNNTKNVSNKSGTSSRSPNCDKTHQPPLSSWTPTKISVDLLEIGDILLVAHGEATPADGVMVNPQPTVTCLLDEAVVTGEARPVEKNKGDAVLAGSFLSSGGDVLLMQVTMLGSGSTLGRIISAVESAQTQKGSTQLLADKLSAKFAPIVLVIGMLTSIAWAILLATGRVPDHLVTHHGNIPTLWEKILFCLRFGIAVLSIACPCSLGLATPTAVLVATGLAASLGILVKGGFAFEVAPKLTHVVLDKTGTLTEGKPAVVAASITPTFVRLLGKKGESAGVISLRGSAWGKLGDTEGDESKYDEGWRKALRNIWHKTRILPPTIPVAPPSFGRGVNKIRAALRFNISNKKNMSGMCREKDDFYYTQLQDHNQNDNDLVMMHDGKVSHNFTHHHHHNFRDSFLSAPSSCESLSEESMEAGQRQVCPKKTKQPSSAIFATDRVKFLGKDLCLIESSTADKRRQLMESLYRKHSHNVNNINHENNQSLVGNNNNNGSGGGGNSLNPSMVMSSTAVNISRKMNNNNNNNNISVSQNEPNISGNHFNSLGISPPSPRTFAKDSGLQIDVSRAFWWALATSETPSQHPLGTGILNFVNSLCDVPPRQMPQSFYVLRGGRGITSVISDQVENALQITIIPLSLADMATVFALQQSSLMTNNNDPSAINRNMVTNNNSPPAAAYSSKKYLTPQKPNTESKLMKCNGGCNCTACGCKPETHCGCLIPVDSASTSNPNDENNKPNDTTPDTATFTAARIAASDPAIHVVRDWSAGQEHLGGTVVLVIASDLIPANFDSQSLPLIDGAIIGAVSLRDPLLPSAKGCIKFLTKERDIKVWMCTGDAPTAARAVADEAGILPANVRAEALPETKAALVKALKEGRLRQSSSAETFADNAGLIRAPKKNANRKSLQKDYGLNSPLLTKHKLNGRNYKIDAAGGRHSRYGTRLHAHAGEYIEFDDMGGSDSAPVVSENEASSANRSVNQQPHAIVAMVGDGTNDAPALATADFGVAVGGHAHVALEASDAVLARAELSDFCNFIILADACVSTIRRNFIWAFAFNILGVPLAAGILFLPTGVHIPPALGGFLMALSSILVVVNSLWLNRLSFKSKEEWACS